MPPIAIISADFSAKLSANFSLASILLGVTVGLVLAVAHSYASRRAAARALASHSAAGVLLGFPIRVGLSAAALFGLAFVGPWALAAGLLAFIPGQRWVLARLATTAETAANS